jgi:hypothetical protein
MKLCVVEGTDGNLYARENEQRLLRNMDVHVVVLDLLKIPYDKVREENNYHLIVFKNLLIGGRYSNESYYEIST